MNINFNNNILDKKNPIILLISKPSDILNVNKFPISHREIIKKISKIKNISQKINEKVSKLLEYSDIKW